MSVAVFGGTGFLGYNFVRHLLEAGDIDLTVFCTSAANLSNLARHPVDYRLVPYPALGSLALDADTEVLVNFAHPFGARDGLSVGQQVRLLERFFRRILEQHRALTLIHVSSMSVYEPFAPGREFPETPLPPNPPRSDHYARAKRHIDRTLLGLGAARHRLLIVRPTVVYGPFCRPWTDNLLRAFAEGDVPHSNLGGRIQPLYGDDLSRFLLERVRGFQPGIFNIGGPDLITWADFLAFFQRVVGRGRLVAAPAAETGAPPGPLAQARGLLSYLLKDQRVKDVAMPLVRSLPAALEGKIRQRFGSPDFRHLRASPETANGAKPFGNRYYGEDRLVSQQRLHERFPAFETIPLEATFDTISAYYQYRFSDAPLV